MPQGECYPAPSSVPLLARHLLPYWRRLLLSCSLIALDRSCPLSQSATPDSRTQRCPAARPKGKNEKLPGGACSYPGNLSFSLPRGHISVPPPVLFKQLLRHKQVLCFFPCTPRASALRQARVSGGNLQNCAPSAACGGAMAPRKNRPFLRSLPPPVPLVLYAMLTLSLPPPST